MGHSALETLFLPFSSGHISEPAGEILIINSQYCGDLDRFTPAQIKNIQWVKPYAMSLESNGFTVDAALGSFTGSYGSYAAALVYGTKSRMETEIGLGKAVVSLKSGGVLICAADNKEGAGRIKKMFQHLGFENIAEASKNKARVCWAIRPEKLDDAPAMEWARQDHVQEIECGFLSRPGLYGWDKIDKGSALLASHLPKDLNGHGADFGCGYGYLARAVLEKNRKAKSIACIDADARAVELCLRNLEAFEVKKTGLWLDLASSKTGLENCYDWIVMNPPFHEGRKSDSDIGISFIKNAHMALRRKAPLLMVANNQLPYERVLSEIFWSSEMIAQGGGFKVFRAIK